MTRIAYVLFAIMGFAAACSGASAATIFKQGPCRHDNEFCRGLISTVTSTQNFRSFTFEAPGPGQAEVSFQGTAVCNNDANTPQQVDFLTQIALRNLDEPLINGPGGLRHVAWLFPSGLLTEHSFNLASTRSINVRRAGPTTVNFLVRQQAMGPDIICLFYNLTFSVVFTP
jgi:hypothetical protein